MNRDGAILIGRGEEPRHLLLPLANRHGLIAGATGTGKTVTLQVLAEGFSRNGVPTVMADIKGDLSGISQAGSPNEKIDDRVRKIGIADFGHRGCPTVFWDVFGEQGHPIRATVSEMGPLLLAQLLDLSEAQEGVLNIAFRQPTIAVDTHVLRVANRTGLAPGATPLAVEQKLLKVTPPEFLQHAHHWLILHGRYVCVARTPKCYACVIREVCRYRPKTPPP